jgi:hypothetical protein
MAGDDVMGGSFTSGIGQGIGIMLGLFGTAWILGRMSKY